MSRHSRVKIDDREVRDIMIDVSKKKGGDKTGERMLILDKRQ